MCRENGVPEDINLLEDTNNQPLKFRTKNQVGRWMMMCMEHTIQLVQDCDAEGKSSWLQWCKHTCEGNYNSC